MSTSRGIPFRNDSGETIPAYAAMRPTGIVVVEDEPIVTVEKPNDQFQRRHYLNGPIDVPKDGFGVAQSGEFPAFARFTEKPAGDPEPDEHWGVIADSWSLGEGREGFVIAGGSYGDRDLSERRTIVQAYDVTTIVAKLTEDLTAADESAKADVQRIVSLVLGDDFEADADTDLDFADSGIIARVFGSKFLGASVALVAGTTVIAQQLLPGNRLVITNTDVCGLSEIPDVGS